MIIYNVTVKINRDRAKEWLDWMKHKHVPDVMNTGQFLDSRICKLLDQDEAEDPTYVIQYHCESRKHFDTYLDKFAPALRDEFNTKYKNQFVLFRTLMEILE